MKYLFGPILFCFSIYPIAFSQETPPLKKGLYAIFDTSEGLMTAVLYEKYTPLTVKNFVGLAQGTKPWLDPMTGEMVHRPLYNGILFHRVVREEMIQAGDPTGIGSHNCGVNIRDEVMPGLRFDIPGRLAMANTGQPDSAGCQFFITDQPISIWNGKYTVFGQLVSGMDVEAKINRKPLRGDRPVDKVILNRVTIQRVP